MAIKVKALSEEQIFNNEVVEEVPKPAQSNEPEQHSDTLKEAISNRDFSKAYKGLQDTKEDAKKEAPIEVGDDLTFDGVVDTSTPEELWNGKEAPAEVDEDLSHIDIAKEPDKDVWNEEKKHTQLVPVIQEDLSTVDVHDAEEAYQSNEFSRKVQPVLKETTEKAVASAVKYQNDKLKLEVAEVLSDEVGYRLSRYEKRRRRRDFCERVSGIAKFIVTVVVILFILGNAQLRLRFALLFENLGDIFVGLVNGEEVESNKLVHDLFRDLGDDLNEVNTKRVGFDIEEATNGVDSTEEVDTIGSSEN